MENDQTERNNIKVVGGRLLLLVALVVNVATTIGVLWLTHGIGSNRGNSERLFDWLDDKSLTLNRNLQADTLTASDPIGTSSVGHGQISIVGRTNDKSPQPEISLNSDYVLMQAKTIGLDGSRDTQYQLRIDRELKDIEITGDILNLRSIQAGASRNDPAKRSGDLSINSPKDLELSGNLGVAIHSRDIYLKSEKEISLVSVEGAIDFSSLGGLFLPNLPIVSHEYVEGQPIGDLNRVHQVCIERPDGSLYRAQMNNC